MPFQMDFVKDLRLDRGRLSDKIGAAITSRASPKKNMSYWNTKNLMMMMMKIYRKMVNVLLMPMMSYMDSPQGKKFL